MYPVYYRVDAFLQGVTYPGGFDFLDLEDAQEQARMLNEASGPTSEVVYRVVKITQEVVQG